MSIAFRIRGPGIDGTELRVQDLPCTIGRDPASGITLPGWRVARAHAELRRIGDGVHLVDLGTLVGTRVNGVRVDAHGPLREADEIEIGGYRLRVRRIADALGSARTMSVDADGDPARATSSPDGAATRPVAVAASSGVSPEHQAVVPVESVPGQRDPGEAAAQGRARLAEAAFELRRVVHRLLLETLDLRRGDLRQLGDAQLRAEVREVVARIVATRIDVPPGMDGERLVDDVVDEAVGLGPLQRLLDDPEITEIMVNRADEIYVERRGRLERTEVAFTGDAAVRGAIERIVAPLGRRIDDSSPMVDARLPDGSRVNAVLPPLAVRGPAITIRRFGRQAFTPDDLVANGSASRRMLDFLRLCVEQRRNLVVSGGTGSGKTSLLNLLSAFVPGRERLITIEDAAELRLTHPHLVALEARPPNAEGRGAVAIRDLVRNALRMRPDRIIVGECRGGEALDMLQAMNTGHEGSMTTVHANGARDALSRLETMALMADVAMPLAAIREQIAAAVDVVVHQARAADGSRRIVRIVEVTGLEGGRLQTADLFLFDQVAVDVTGRPTGRFRPTGLVPAFFDTLRAAGLEPDLGLVHDDASHALSEGRSS